MLEDIEMTSTAQLLRKIIDDIKAIDKVVIYSRTFSKDLYILSTRISHIRRDVLKTNNKELFKDELEDFVANLKWYIDIISSKYIRIRLIVMLLITFYTILSISLIAAAKELLLFLMNSMLWSSIIVLMLFLLNLSFAILATASLPIIYMLLMIIAILVEKSLAYYVPLSLHGVAAVIGVWFLLMNIDNYKQLNLAAEYFSRELHDIIEVAHGIFKKIEKWEIDTKKYLSIYGDKAYELIKYIHDVQKLA